MAEPGTTRALTPPERVQLLRDAFPSVGGEHRCAWCSSKRQRNHALCRDCWQHRLTQTERDRYWSMGLIARATWIVENKRKSSDSGQPGGLRAGTNKSLDSSPNPKPMTAEEIAAHECVPGWCRWIDAGSPEGLQALAEDPELVIETSPETVN